ncbi:PQ-loop repeat-containing protein [Mycoplasmopsis caviae]|uniref:PQ loop repeat n=1 Tax=Mycoplasmopsis caviae TaxID=55603 RepID=A0A3P8L7Y7_9BACT|nr:PQ-loop repeat-containing protein [Mycoplasmopsis caviae]UUD34741.1 PQ-loop repeat-containing protein [Mycoplasmopsis caviae]VDR42435.1 PQ loop repeat [Mycoplasmopsis caviae]
MEYVQYTFGTLASIVMVALCIPQIIQLLKTKKVGNVSYPTFIIYFFGGFIFVLTMLLKSGVGVYKLEDPIVNVLGNVIFTILMAFTITLFFIYDTKAKNGFKIGIGSLLWLLVLVGITFTIAAYSSPKARLNLGADNGWMIAASVIATCCCALPFTIQIAKTIKSKSADGISLPMLYLGIILNALLCIYLGLVVKFNTPTWYVFVIFQLIAIVVYVIQIYFYYYYKNRTSKQQETNVEKQN